MKPKHTPRIQSPLWCDMVNHRLSHGYGVEDIALQMQCSVETVRFHVRSLRAQGKLKPLYDKMRFRMMEGA
jgi:DNA-directed RNA polymerase specialized sigma24 family protein